MQMVSEQTKYIPVYSTSKQYYIIDKYTKRPVTALCAYRNIHAARMRKKELEASFKKDLWIWDSLEHDIIDGLPVRKSCRIQIPD